MSLVHEALQKAEREKQQKAGVWTAPAQKPSPRLVQPLGANESLPATVSKSTPADKPAAPVTMMSATVTSATAQSLRPAAVATADPQKKQSGLLAVLIVCVSLVAIVAIVFLVSLAASAIREARQPVQPAAAVQPTHAPAATEPKPNEPASQPVVASAPVGVTPQQPPAPPSDSGFRLTGIMVVPNGRYAAVLNGRVVYESSSVDDATVKKIERERVTLVDAQGKEVVLRLN